jgi:hypothetical protein
MPFPALTGRILFFSIDVSPLVFILNLGNKLDDVEKTNHQTTSCGIFSTAKSMAAIGLKIRVFSRLSPEKAHSKTYCTTIVQRILYNKSRGNARKIFGNA